LEKIILFICMALMLSLTIITIHARAQTIVDAQEEDIPSLDEDLASSIVSDVESSIDRAVAGIQGAAAAGADVSALTDKFNLGLDFLRQVQDSDFRSCSYSEDCQVQANETFVSITKESAILMEQYEAASNYHRIMTYALFVPSVAFAASLFIFYLFKVWKSYQIKRFLDMEISEKED
jgi:hypothetical protein